MTSLLWNSQRLRELIAISANQYISWALVEDARHKSPRWELQMSCFVQQSKAQRYQFTVIYKNELKGALCEKKPSNLERKLFTDWPFMLKKTK